METLPTLINALPVVVGVDGSVLPTPSVSASSRLEKQVDFPTKLLDYFTAGIVVMGPGFEWTYRQQYQLVQVCGHLYRATAIDRSDLEVVFDIPPVAQDADPETVSYPASMLVRFGMIAGVITAVGVSYELRGAAGVLTTIEEPFTWPSGSWRVVRYANPSISGSRIIGRGVLAKLVAAIDTEAIASSADRNDKAMRALRTIIPMPQMCRFTARNDGNFWSHYFTSDYEVTTDLRLAPIGMREALFEQIHIGSLRAYLDIDYVSEEDLDRLPQLAARIREVFYRRYGEPSVTIHCLLSTELKISEPGKPGTHSMHLIIESACRFRSPLSIKQMWGEAGIIKPSSKTEDAVEFPLELMALQGDPKVYSNFQKFRYDAAPKGPGFTRIFKLVSIEAPRGPALPWPAEPSALLVGDTLYGRGRAGEVGLYYDFAYVYDLGVLYATRENAAICTDAEFVAIVATIDGARGKLCRSDNFSVFRTLASMLKQFENSKRMFKLFFEFYNEMLQQMNPPNIGKIDGSFDGLTRGSTSIDPVRIWNRAKNRQRLDMKYFERFFRHSFFERSRVIEGDVTTITSIEFVFDPVVFVFESVPQDWSRTYTDFKCNITYHTRDWLSLSFDVYASQHGIHLSVATHTIRAQVGGILHVIRGPRSSYAVSWGSDPLSFKTIHVGQSDKMTVRLELGAIC